MTNLTPGSNIDSVAVAGVTFDNNQAHLWRLAQTRKTSWLYLKREPKNAHDANAIRVMIGRRGAYPLAAGYVPKKLAKTLAPLMDAGQRVSVMDYRFVGGNDKKKTLGVRMTLHLNTNEAAPAYAYATI